MASSVRRIGMLCKIRADARPAFDHWRRLLPPDVRDRVITRSSGPTQLALIPMEEAPFVRAKFS